MSELKGFFEALAEGGQLEGDDLTFTLESEKARRKLREFAVAHPEHFQLLALAGMYAMGARQFQVRTDVNTFSLTTELQLSRNDFSNLWSYAGGSGERHGLRLLALSFLTSARLDHVEWSVSSRDPQGDWGFRLPIRKGEVHDLVWDDKAVAGEGSVLVLQRRSVGQVARRYLGWLRDRLTQGEGEDVRRLRERLFLTTDSQLTVNACAFRRRHEALPEKALAVLVSGPVPHLVDTALSFRRDTEHTIGVVLCAPEPNVGDEPRRSTNTALWIWNGLTMDTTSLGDEFTYFRAFIWADRLQPDLSLNQLISNRAKQAMERTVKSMARDLLHRYVDALTQEILACSDTSTDEPFRPRLQVVKKALRERISLKRERTRLASLNRSLVACPLFLGSDSEGVVRWWTFDDLWKEVENKRHVAASTGPVRVSVPAFPGRPVVLNTDHEDWKMLSVLLPNWALKTVGEVSDRVQSMRRGGQRLQAPQGDYQGRLTLPQGEFRWRYGAALGPSVLSCWVPEGGYALRPWSQRLEGFFVTTKVQLEGTYDATLVDQGLSESLERSLIEALCVALAECPAGPRRHDVYAKACQTVLHHVVERGVSQATLETAWLPVYFLGEGVARWSPRALRERLAELDSPCFELTRAPSEDASELLQPWSQLPIVLSAPEARQGLSALLACPVISARPWAGKLGKLPRPSEEASIWTQDLEAPQRFSELQSLRVGVLAEGRVPFGHSRLVELRGGLVVAERTQAWIYPGLLVQAEWSRGWPGCEGTPWELCGEKGQEAMLAGCLELGRMFLLEASTEQMLAAPPALLASWTFDLLSDPENAHHRLLLRADGSKVSLLDLPAEVVAFHQPGDFDQAAGEAVYLPGELAETADLLFDNIALRPCPVQLASQRDPATYIGGESEEDDRENSGPDGAMEVVSEASPGPQLVTENGDEIYSDRELGAGDDPREESPGKGPPRADVQGPESLLQSEAETTNLAPPSKAAPSLPAPEISLPAVDVSTTVEGSQLLAPDLIEPRGQEGLGPLLSDLLEIGPQERWQGYASFLKNCRLDPNLADIVALRHGVATVGSRGWGLLSHKASRAYLHSALFSLYNRSMEAVTDQHERAFHQALLGWLLERKGPAPIGSKDSHGERTTLD